MTFSGRQIAAVRSFLFVPLSNEKLIRKAGSSSADAIILDLEDGVSISEKTVARENLKKHASLIEDAGKFVVVRINAESEMAPLDVEALVHVRPDAVMVPKFESVEQIADTIGMLRSKGSGRQVGIIGLIETLSLIHIVGIGGFRSLYGCTSYSAATRHALSPDRHDRCGFRSCGHLSAILHCPFRGC